MSYPSSPPPLGRGQPRPTINLRDQAAQRAPLADAEQAHYAPRGGDLFLLGLLIVVLLSNGLFIWHQVGPAQAHVGRAVFFGLALLCVYWGAIVYTFKLSVSVRVGPHGVSIMRGPWRTELPWREVARLVERAQVVNGQRFRWVVVLARDGRRLQVREDMVTDYARFRIEVYERYSLWHDHGGTWGATGGGPFTSRETLSSQVLWWAVVGAMLVLPGIYFAVLLPETRILGPALVALSLVCAVLSGRAALRRQTYTVDARAIEARRFYGTVRLPWREVARVDRARHPASGVVEVTISMARWVLRLIDRNDTRMRSFDWSPRVPEYLTLRGSGRQIRICLHRVARPDELLAWVEFYERFGRRSAANERQKTTSTTLRPLAPPEPLPIDLSSPLGPSDPWANAAEGEPSAEASVPTDAPLAASTGADGMVAAAPPANAFAAAPATNDAEEATAALPAVHAPESDGPDEAEQARSAPPWRHDPAWQRPPLPRFGPAAPADEEPASGEQFTPDQFLR